MRIRAVLSCALCLAVMLLAAPLAIPQEQAPVSRVWNFTAKMGMEAEFEEAVVAHLAFLAEQGHSWQWIGFTVETGENVGDYGFVSGAHALSDFDEYDAEMRDAAMADFREKVAPYVESMSTSIVAAMPQISRPPGPEATFNFVQVITFRVRFDQTERFESAVGRYHDALENVTYTWSQPMSGFEDGPNYTLLLYHDSWASMGGPPDALEAAMVEAYGRPAARSLAEDFSDSVLSVSNWIARLRPDLSYIPGQ